MKTYASISDFLTAHGYEVETDYFVKKEGPRWTFIYPYQWQGLSVEAFIAKAREKGWVSAEEGQPEIPKGDRPIPEGAPYTIWAENDGKIYGRFRHLEGIQKVTIGKNAEYITAPLFSDEGIGRSRFGDVNQIKSLVLEAQLGRKRLTEISFNDLEHPLCQQLAEDLLSQRISRFEWGGRKYVAVVVRMDDKDMERKFTFSSQGAVEIP